MRKIIALTVLFAVIISTGVVVVAVTTKDNLTIKPYYKKGELESILNDDTILASGFFDSDVLDGLTPIEAERFMFYVSQDKDKIINKSFQPHTLDQFNDIFVIECIRRIDDDQIAVIYKLKLESDFVFAFVVFNRSQVDYSNSIIDPGVYDLWSYRGECYFYSEKMSSLVDGEAKPGMLFREFNKNISGIEYIFTPSYNTESNMWNWSTIILTETGAKQIVFGIEKTADTIERSAITDSVLIEVVAIDCNWIK